MDKTLLLIMLLAHLLGDFYFQSDRMSERKNSHYSALVKHSVFYLLTSIIICAPFYSIDLLIAMVGLSVIHYAIDSLKFICIKKFQIENAEEIQVKSRKRIVYIADQLLHIISILLICLIFVLKGLTIAPIPIINSLFQILTLSPYQCLRWLVLLLTIWKPVNITIKHLLLPFKPEMDREPQTNLNLKSGAFIGGLERTVILVLLSVQQYSAIGLVLTAKSIARYSKIQEDKAFAEYYLLGTLLSTLAVILIFLII